MHRSPARSLLTFTALLSAACAGDRSSVLAPRLQPLDRPLFVIGGCPTPWLTSGILQPVNADGSSVFELTRTIPLKIRITDCTTLAAVETAMPMVMLQSVADDGTVTAVNEVESSSAADDGVTMRPAGNGQYIFNLSTKRSQFNAGQDLLPGRYELRISDPGKFQDVVVQFRLRR